MATNELPPPVLPKAGYVCCVAMETFDICILYLSECLKILVTHVEDGPELFYVQVCSNETFERLQCLERMTSVLNKVS